MKILKPTKKKISLLTQNKMEEEQHMVDEFADCFKQQVKDPDFPKK